MRGFANLTWVEADIEGNNATGTALDGANEIRNRILSAGGGIGCPDAAAILWTVCAHALEERTLVLERFVFGFR